MENSIAIQANKEKIGTLLAYIGKNVLNLNLRKLIKLVYLIDERSILEKGYPLTWLDYYVWEKGPVAPEIYGIKDGGGIFFQFVKVEKNKESDKYIITPNTHFNLEKGLIEFSQSQIDLINSVLKENREVDADTLTEITHKEGGVWATMVRNNNISFEKNPQTDIKINLVDRKSEKYQDYLEAYDSICFAASLNN